MQRFSRILAVLVAVLSVAFMGFAAVVAFGGPNWKAEADSLEGYTFSRSEGENPIWSATRAAGGQELTTKDPLLPKVYLAALQDRTNRAREEVTVLTDAAPKLEEQIKLYKDFQDKDTPALDGYFMAMKQRQADVYAQMEQAAKQQDAITAEVKKLEDQLDSRRQDVYQLELQYRVVKSDQERIRENITAVKEQIRLLEDELDKAQRRERTFQQQGL